MKILIKSYGSKSRTVPVTIESSGLKSHNPQRRSEPGDTEDDSIGTRTLSSDLQKGPPEVPAPASPERRETTSRLTKSPVSRNAGNILYVSLIFFTFLKSVSEVKFFIN